MIIENIKLKNFRNYDEITINFSKKLNYIYGFNAQGKTNILEAIYFSGCGKSHRTNRDICLLKEGQEEFYVKTSIDYENEIKKEIQLSYNKNTKKKELRINGNKQQSIGELFGKMNMVFFSPEDLMLIKEGPSCRRRQIDISLSQVRPSYFYDLSKYYRILSQKNNLLKEIKKKNSLLETLDVWSENLALYGAKVIVKRQEYIHEIEKIAKDKHNAISDNKEAINMLYNTFLDKNECAEKVIAAKLYEKYKQNREKEIIIGSTFIGPHRDDIVFQINGYEAKSFASQGQQRSLVLSFKMAQLEYISRIVGERPILLLDDVFSELDEKRKKYIYENLSNIQTFITGTKKDDIIKEKFRDIKYLHVEKGNVREE